MGREGKRLLQTKERLRARESCEAGLKMLAHRLIAAVEIRNKEYSDGREVDMDFEERGKDILNKMLTTLTQSLGLLLPSSID
jgi:hypothetical protein